MRFEHLDSITVHLSVKRINQCRIPSEIHATRYLLFLPVQQIEGSLEPSGRNGAFLLYIICQKEVPLNHKCVRR